MKSNTRKKIVCVRCKIETSDRYKGLSNHLCKPCYRVTVALFYKKKRAFRKQQMLEHYKNNYNTQEEKERLKENGRLMYKLHNSDFRARGKFHYLIKTGKIEREEKCSKCNSTDRVEAHHYKGYKGENYKVVQWLCTPCHNDAHYKSKYYSIS